MLFASAAVLMVGCEKENTSPSNGNSPSQQITTYTVSVSGIQVPSGMALEVLAVEYSASNERLQINRFDLTSSSMTRNYTANSRTEKSRLPLMHQIRVRDSLHLYGFSKCSILTREPTP